MTHLLYLLIIRDYLTENLLSCDNRSRARASGFEENSPERSERCGRIVADITRKTVEMLNDLADESFVAAYAVPDNVIGCNSCHGPDGALNNVMSKMDCDSCHTDQHTNKVRNLFFSIG